MAFLDDDDFWNDKKLEKQVAIFEKDSQIGLVYCGYERITNNKIVTRIMPDPKFKGKIGIEVFTKIFSITSCLVVKKNLLEEIGGFDEKLGHWQEYDLSIRISKISNIDFVDECLVTIISTTKDPSRLSNQVAVSYTHLDVYKRQQQHLSTLIDKKKLFLHKKMLLQLTSRCV
ncbi:hypothetical protein A5848_000433 [Enterococcus faecium]|nr:hypothetical protein A5848_000433 [Enterococcus faecium]